MKTSYHKKNISVETFSMEQILDETFGKTGTETRDKYESELKSELDMCCIGSAIRHARKAKNMTQEELGEIIGIKKAQISRIESGKNLTFSTVAKIFKAMDISAKLDLGAYGRVSLW